MSKDLKPKQRLGQAGSKRGRIITWSVLGLLAAGGGYAAWRYQAQDEPVEVAVAKVRKGEFVIAVRTRGEVKSVNSVFVTAPQVPDSRIVAIAESGKFVK